jgi:putative transcriptional regulator
LQLATPISDNSFVMHSGRDFSWSEVGNRIRQRRTVRGLSQQALADAADLTQNAIYRLEAGESNPQITTLQRVAAGLGCTVRELVCGAAEMASGVSDRVNRVRTIIESGDHDAIRMIDHGIEAAEILLVRSERRRTILSADRKVVLKGEGREGPTLTSLWNERPPGEKSEAVEIITTTDPELIRVGEKQMRRSKARP